MHEWRRENEGEDETREKEREGTGRVYYRLHIRQRTHLVRERRQAKDGDDHRALVVEDELFHRPFK